MKFFATLALLALTSASASFFSAPSMVAPSYECLDRKPRADFDPNSDLASNPDARAEVAMLSPFWAPPANWPANERQSRHGDEGSNSGKQNRR
mmetsp:Transcript_30559/g.70739  ORF Transcript_30559/g.70739 Transcript_30559/m.70739 type:complete len:93 (+) Transcript_30559:172-450(+)